MNTETKTMQSFPHQPPPDDGAPSSRLMSLVFLLISLQFGVDLIWDKVQGDASYWHLGIEAASGTICLVLGLRLFLALRRRSRMILHLKLALQASQEEADRWRGEAAQALQGLGRAMDLQFARWNLSQAEREVALFLLKGYSSRDISEMRTTSERTARQQAQDVYRKAGLSGRAELSAFFLEDLLLPSSTRRQQEPG